jgi:cysteinyl-tRNA synthetase
MNLYNSMSRRVEQVVFDHEPITFYVCGITPYDTTHLGHAFTYTVADVLIRYLEYQNRRVLYVQNVTDIDDDILREAKKRNEGDWREVGNRWTRHFIRDMQALNVRPPDYYPRATDVIPEIIEAVQALIDAGVAYVANGSVYYSVEAWPEFGKLSHMSREEMLPVANERGNNPDDPNKRDPLDFVLWQAHAPGEPYWESPWGRGRPGWHIECSSMVSKYLGDTIDLHSGGGDLQFPHHECEIAQIEPISGRRPFVRHWLHTAMVEMDGEKMSKSLGNLVMVRDLLETYSADALRYYLANHHYREPWEYNAAELDDAAAAAEELRVAATIQDNDATGMPLNTTATQDAFAAAMEDDLDTPTALRLLRRLAGAIVETANRGQRIYAAQNELRRMATVFGLRLGAEQPEARVLEGWNAHLKRFE